MPQGLPADSTPSPGPEFRKGLLTPVCPPEAVQNSAEGGQEILRYIRGSRFSETQPRGFQGKAGGGGQGGRVSTAGCAKWFGGICLLPAAGRLA